MSRKNEEAVKFILKQQQERDKKGDAFFTTITIEHDYDRGKDYLDELFSESEEVKPNRQWQEKMERLVQDEVRKLASKRKESEKSRRIHETKKAKDHSAKERERAHHHERKTKVRREDVERKAWDSYESKWNTIASSSESVESTLKFSEIPWPMVHQPKSVTEINSSMITSFLLSSHHSEGHSRKERIKGALRRWHPDRFGRVLQRVAESDRAKVEEGAGIVVRCLNDLLEKEG